MQIHICCGAWLSCSAAEIAKGLEMAVSTMNVGEKALVKCGPEYGYSKTRRPAQLTEGEPIEFEVELVRFEKASFL